MSDGNKNDPNTGQAGGAVNVAASIDAYATRLAASIEPHPDPRAFMEEGTQTETVAILAPVEGTFEIGVELFDQGEATAGGNCLARAGSILAAQSVRGLLLIQPTWARGKGRAPVR